MSSLKFRTDTNQPEHRWRFTKWHRLPLSRFWGLFPLWDWTWMNLCILHIYLRSTESRDKSQDKTWTFPVLESRWESLAVQPRDVQPPRTIHINLRFLTVVVQRAIGVDSILHICDHPHIRMGQAIPSFQVPINLLTPCLLTPQNLTCSLLAYVFTSQIRTTVLLINLSQYRVYYFMFWTVYAKKIRGSI